MTSPTPDLSAFAAELTALRARVVSELGSKDLQHLYKIQRWGRVATVLGLATCWIVPNPVSAFLLAQGRFARWTMMGHHVLHRGYDAVPGVPENYTSRVFARGGRRLLDWLDVILPEAWDHEHNVLHHYRLGEDADPDLVERNLQWLRDSSLPNVLKVAIVAVLASGWRFLYYAPNTLAELQEARAKKAGDTSFVPTGGLLDPATWSPFDPRGRELWLRCFLPYILVHLILVPLLFAPLGMMAMTNVLLNQLLAEWITNLQTFLVIVPNHAGLDVERFETAARGREAFFYRQVVGSVNYACGDDLTDFFHGFLNYQIEHHLFPDLPMQAYQKIQPEVKEICARHGIPYVQESVFTRLRKTVDIMIGRTSMRLAH